MKDYNVLGSILGSPYFWEATIYTLDLIRKSQDPILHTFLVVAISRVIIFWGYIGAPVFLGSYHIHLGSHSQEPRHHPPYLFGGPNIKDYTVLGL